MARALQTLVLARDGVLSPVFCSIEEWLGRNTDAYYKILEAVGEGRWHPEHDALPWVRFCLVAHYQQAATLIKRGQVIGRAWSEIEKEMTRHSLHERMGMPLLDATFGFSVKSAKYQEENGVSDVVASRDLRRLCELGLLTPVGEKRGRHYVAAKPLNDIFDRVKDTRRAPNPYTLIGSKNQPSLPGLAPS
jgi:Fic family protein